MQHLVKWVKGASFVIAYTIGAQGFAKTQEIAVKLHSLDVVHQQEKRGDELYLNITEFPAQSKAHYYQVPSYPSHWLSKYAASIKDVVIWRKSLNQCEPINLLITLVEEDFAPWNVDDTLGSVELKIECVNGKAVETWSIPNPKNTVQIKSQKNAFSFQGSNAEYHAIFKLENAFSKHKDNNLETERKEREAIPLNTLIP